MSTKRLTCTAPDCRIATFNPKREGCIRCAASTWVSEIKENKLKKCPFCGKLPLLSMLHYTWAVSHRCAVVETVISRGKKEDVMAVWNTRV